LLEQQQLRSSSAGGFCWLGLGLVTVLGLAILLDGWLLNIVLLAHLHLKKAAKQESAKSGGQKWRRQTQDTAAGCCWLEELQSRQTSLGRRPPTVSTFGSGKGTGQGIDESSRFHQEHIHSASLSGGKCRQ
jgi:hypothetical protein